MSRILLAEDDNDMRRFLVKALQNAGYDVVSFDNGLSAYERIREEPFTLLLTDIVMPEMDGIELARRATELDPDLKVMFITGFAAVALNPEFERAAIGQGAIQAVPSEGPRQRGREAARRLIRKAGSGLQGPSRSVRRGLNSLRAACYMLASCRARGRPDGRVAQRESTTLTS